MTWIPHSAAIFQGRAGEACDRTVGQIVGKLCYFYAYNRMFRCLCSQLRWMRMFGITSPRVLVLLTFCMFFSCVMDFIYRYALGVELTNVK